MLQTIAWISIGVALVAALVIAVDEVRRPQMMGIMNVVWPTTALYGGVLALWGYLAKGRAARRKESAGAGGEMTPMDGQGRGRRGPTLTQTAVATSHCGAGCALADLVTEFAVYGTGATVMGSALYASFVWDFLAAWTLGVVFQFFSIQPMRKLSVGQGLWAAVKADTLSIVSFQVGMYAWMALVQSKLFPEAHLRPTEPVYWLMMQIAMGCGFLTALPMNWVLVRAGLKEAMG